jgi:transcriptional regulator with XRE-family HTH domain
MQYPLANNLKTLRTHHGLTQQQVATLLGHKSNDRVSHWEKGKMVPSLKNLMKLCTLYEVSLNDLVTYGFGVMFSTWLISTLCISEKTKAIPSFSGMKSAKETSVASS